MNVVVYIYLQDIEKEKKRAENPNSFGEDEEAEVAEEITAAQFEESMMYARRSVSDVDILKYEWFAWTLQQSRGIGIHSAESGTGSDTFEDSARGDHEDVLLKKHF